MTSSPTDAAYPEKRLLLSCARTKSTSATEREIRELASLSLDWNYLLSEAAQNSLIPLLHLQLGRLAADLVPSAQMGKLEAASRANTARCLLYSGELVKVMEALNSKGVKAVPYKGPALAAQAYGNIALRQFADLDVIVRHSDLPGAHAAMLELAYVPKFPWNLLSETPSVAPVEYTYLNEARQTMVEIQTERSLRHFPVALDLDDLAKNLVSVPVSDHEILTFSAEDGIPILCVHGAKDFWERFSWIADISEMIESHPDLDWEAICNRADSLGAGRMLDLGLKLASDLLGAALPTEVLTRVKGDLVAGEWAARIEERLLSRELPLLGAAARFRFRRQMVTGTLAGWEYGFRLATAPAEEDWEMARLPKPLAALYMALRPLRLWRKYGSGR